MLISNLVKPDELRLRPQTMPEGLFHWRHYRRIAVWYCESAMLYQHKRSGAVWLVQNGIGQVVFQDATCNAILELVHQQMGVQ